MKELTIPPAAYKDAASAEVLRVWIANQQQHVTLLYDAWEDPGVWGIFLADLARHVVNAFEQKELGDPEELLVRIRALFNAELDSPTDTAKGSIVAN